MSDPPKQQVLTRWLTSLPVPAFMLFTTVAAFSSYFCMYAFRKPFSAAELFRAVDRALERRWLTLQNRQYQETLEQINEVVAAVSKGKDSQEVFELIYRTLGEILPCNRIAVGLFDGDGGTDDIDGILCSVTFRQAC